MEQTLNGIQQFSEPCINNNIIFEWFEEQSSQTGQR